MISWKGIIIVFYFKRTNYKTTKSFIINLFSKPNIILSMCKVKYNFVVFIKSLLLALCMEKVFFESKYFLIPKTCCFRYWKSICRNARNTCPKNREDYLKLYPIGGLIHAIISKANQGVLFTAWRAIKAKMIFPDCLSMTVFCRIFSS